jgi:hypothetical protein
MRKRISSPRLVMCIDNWGYAPDLEPKKIYRVVPDAERHAEIRVIDESGEDPIFPAACFVSVASLGPRSGEKRRVCQPPSASPVVLWTPWAIRSTFASLDDCRFRRACGRAYQICRRPGRRFRSAGGRYASDAILRRAAPSYWPRPIAHHSFDAGSSHSRAAFSSTDCASSGVCGARRPVRTNSSTPTSR